MVVDTTMGYFYNGGIITYLYGYLRNMYRDDYTKDHYGDTCTTLGDDRSFFGGTLN